MRVVLDKKKPHVATPLLDSRKENVLSLPDGKAQERFEVNLVVDRGVADDRAGLRPEGHVGDMGHDLRVQDDPIFRGHLEDPLRRVSA
jgi:hypothetical protein